MTWQSNLNWDTAVQRADVLRKIREFFYSRNIIEVETPLLSTGTVTDVHLDSFSCQYDYSSTESSQPKELYLQTSPEFAMKRLLSSGYHSIYQICKAFRHEVHGKHHNPEFSMLEWYRVGFDHFQLMDEVGDLLSCILKCGSAQRMSYQQAFLKYLDIDPLTCTNAELKQLLSVQGVLGDWISKEQDTDLLLQVLFSECIERKLGSHVPCFIYNYPRNQSALAKISVQDPRVSERFECYYKGIELANGFNELTDANEQISRFEVDNINRQSLGKIQKPLDKLFLAALENGLPACAGVAVGIDRLMMLALDKADIASTMTFNITNA
ncbi:elongation factor P--(R)-beta-lysine ligase [Colwellia sp. 1_MG-2023]|uniref:elongation factor P--(R)-beta-lysine ligase n=1 Tax=Colwellia sp. 1_MG-2023 TaxID=3062649 RepID=UPI0026E2AD48|nr:elongation factor P--(R)-beta-lysine ligase [Colwellia sp. 1_MG-2023]MDO6444912.1 elongation factor P--(R)-beta-lysine ligase [Colwellia sp. 1_MG-2023]